MSDEIEGWGVRRPGDRVFHYYRRGMSLCRKVGFFPMGPETIDEVDQTKPYTKGPADCAGCAKALAKEKA